MTLSGIPAKVSNLVNKAGQTVTYKRVTGQTFNAATGINTVTYTDYTVRAAVRDYSPREITGNVMVGDRVARIAAYDLSFTPQKDDQIVIDGITYIVIAPNPRKVADDQALYTMQIRGA